MATSPNQAMGSTQAGFVDLSNITGPRDDASRFSVSAGNSRTTSPEFGKSQDSYLDEDLPTNVSTPEHLAEIPDFCLSGNSERPLRHVNEKGDVCTYALQPMFYSVIFILLVELLERFSFYGIQYTQTSFLTGAYDRSWNAGMTAVGASSYVSISTAIAYSMPFVGAYLADSLLGDYWAVLFGAIVLYIPGLVLIVLSSVPGLLGETFNRGALALGLLVLWPTGTGVVKSIVNVFGAKQFHPLLQSSLIESYYVNFYSKLVKARPATAMLLAEYSLPAFVSVYQCWSLDWWDHCSSYRSD